MNTSKAAFYLDQTQVPLLATYVYFPFNFAARYLIIMNDEGSGSNQVVWSFDGINQHGFAKATESFTFDDVDAAGIYLKYVTGAPAYRVMARPE